MTTMENISKFIKDDLDKKPIDWEDLFINKKAMSLFNISSKLALGTVFDHATINANMACILSDIIVVSARDRNASDKMVDWANILFNSTNGSLNELLKRVTRSEAMGIYLTMMDSKYDPDNGITPDENYARELMQLFTIGLYKLNMNGSLVEPITNSYSTQDIVELSRVFAGFEKNYNNLEQFSGSRTNVKNMYFGPVNLPVVGASLSDDQQFQIDNIDDEVSLNRKFFERLDSIIDQLCNHYNVAPFWSKLWIQRTITSNPEPSYIRDVAKSFLTGFYLLPDGSVIGEGRRNDLRVLHIASILEGYKRDFKSANSDISFGRWLTYGEVVRKCMGIFCTRRSDLQDSWQEQTQSYAHLRIDNTDFGLEPSDPLGGTPFNAPSVFGWFNKSYSEPGSEESGRGLVFPELELRNPEQETKFLEWVRDIWSNANFFYDKVNLSRFDFENQGKPKARDKFAVGGMYDANDYYKIINESQIGTIPKGLIDKINFDFTGNRMSSETIKNIEIILKEVANKYSDDRDEYNLNMFRECITLALLSPETHHTF